MSTRSKRWRRDRATEPWEIFAKTIDMSEIAIFGRNIVTLGG